MDIKDLIVLAVTRGFHPKFTELSDVGACADRINFPHEDYPVRVEDTKTSIVQLIDFATNSSQKELTEFNLKGIHSFVMKGLPSRGAYRRIGVRVGNYIPPDALHVPDLMAANMPLSFDSNTLELINWYTIFETIHPFEEGNGRVGGIVVAALSFAKTGKYLTPMQ